LVARADGKPLVGFRVESAAAKSLRVTAGEEGKPAAGRFVRIELPGKGKMLSLAEVQVFRNGQNVALKGMARQSSTAFDGEAKRAIDGNTNGDYYGANSTTHTGTEANPWWEVRLAEAGPVERIAIWNRTDGGLHVRLANFRVSLLDDNRRVVWMTTV